MLRWLSHVRRRVEQLATQAGSGRCNGDHQRHRVVHIHGAASAPAWPEKAAYERCACGAELEYFQVVHQHIAGAHPNAATVKSQHGPSDCGCAAALADHDPIEASCGVGDDGV